MTTTPTGAAPPRVPTICQAAVDLLIFSEVTGRKTYERLYAKPTWPGGESGVTIGIGWDLGQNTADDLAREWAQLDRASRFALSPALGVTGAVAGPLAKRLSGVTILWEEAVATFTNHTLPRFALQTVQAFPGAADLPPECFGALLDLVYNRGGSMGTAGKPSWETRREMRAIRDLIRAGRLAEVPEQLRAMQRLWPDAEGLRVRRRREASLWEKGLAAARKVA